MSKVTQKVCVLCLSLVIDGFSVGCSSSGGAASNASTETTFARAAANNLTAQLTAAGYSESQIEILTTAGGNAASGFSLQSIRFLSNTNSQNITTSNTFWAAVEKELDNPSAAFTATQKAEIMGLLIKSLVLTFKEKSPGIADSSDMDTMVEGLISTAVEHLGDIGLASSEIENAAQSIVKATVSHLDELAGTSQMENLIAKVATVSVSSLGTINGVSPSNYSGLVKCIAEGITASVGNAGVTATSDVGTLVQNIGTSIVTAVGTLGISATNSEFQNLITSVTEGTIAGIGSLGVTNSSDLQNLSQLVTVGIIGGCNNVSGFDSSILTTVETSIQSGASNGFAQYSGVDGTTLTNLTNNLQTYISGGGYTSAPSYTPPPAPSASPSASVSPSVSASASASASPSASPSPSPTPSTSPSPNASEIASIDILVSAPDADNSLEIFDYGSNLVDVPAGHCSTVTVTTLDVNNNALTMHQAVDIQMSDVAAHAVFYTDASCTQATTTLTVPLNSDHGIGYIKTTHSGTMFVEAQYGSATGSASYEVHASLPVDIQTIPSVDFFADTSCPQYGENTVRIQLIDIYGNISFPRANTLFHMVAADSAHTTVMDPINCVPSNDFTIAAFASQVDVAFIVDNAGSADFTFSKDSDSSFPSTTLTYNFVIPDAVFLTGAQGAVTATGMACTALGFLSVDYQFNNRNVPADVVATLDDGGSGHFFSDSGCTTPITTATILAGQHQQQFYYQNYTPGSYSLHIDATNFIGTTLPVQITP